jgi:glyoxylase-like metal-dependent hydrolase (beta-lactamase superfamily II)
MQGTVDVNVPIGTLWSSFVQANLWPRWNKCFFWARNKSLVKGQHLIWAFQPIKPWLPYKMWAIANIVELGQEQKVTWEVTAFPGMYARHTYHMEDLGDGRTRFGSWEQGMGWGFRLTRWFWLKHFTFVKDESLAGALALEAQYRRTGALNAIDMPKKSYVGFWLLIMLLLAILVALITAGVIYEKYVRITSTELVPGIHVFFGGVGNSLLVQDGGQSLLVDTKCPPGSTMLHRWIEQHGAGPVIEVVNTHYHFDHTQGNSLYHNADKIAYRQVPVLMRKYDDDWWGSHADGIPTDLIDGERVLYVGSVEVMLEHPPPAHTSGDLWVYLPKQKIIATGDLVFNGYYPFLDQPEGGTSIPGMITAVRALAHDHPDAVFLPGHGPLASAGDLLRYANFLEALQIGAAAAHASGWTEDEAARRNDLARWHLSVLPSYHHKKLTWSTSSNDARWAYVLTSSASETTE